MTTLEKATAMFSSLEIVVEDQTKALVYRH